jgi:DNA ligase-1
MRDFTGLFSRVEQTTKTNAKVEALVHYFRTAKESDKIWCIAILTGNTPRRTVKTSELREWTAELSGLPLWLFEESYYIVGDLAETIALCLPEPEQVYEFSLEETLALLAKLANSDPEGRKAVIQSHWMHIPKEERFVFNKLITGNFRMGVSRQLVIKALAIYLELEENDIAHRLMGKWNPAEEHMGSLFRHEALQHKYHQPYPFFLAYQLEAAPDTLGHINDWFIEKKFDGIRGQIIVRNGDLFVWSRGEELLTDKFPELTALKFQLPEGTVLDGELIPWKDNTPLAFQVMQTRISRKKLTPKVLAAAPVVMICYDLLEYEGHDVRNEPLLKRRALLEQLLATLPIDTPLKLSPLLHFENWQDVAAFRKDARDASCEGVMIKNKNSVYETGRRRGNWWKWKTAPLTVDGVLIYAQSGHGRRANLFTDYTFAVWDGDTLVPFAKAYSGLTDKEITELDNWVKRHTVEKFGPVRSVQAELVFEIAFEGINESPRHKSGVALRFPRILRWRRDKAAADANTKNDLLDLLAAGTI